jgi:hypothetical protein
MMPLGQSAEAARLQCPATRTEIRKAAACKGAASIKMRLIVHAKTGTHTRAPAYAQRYGKKEMQLLTAASLADPDDHTPATGSVVTGNRNMFLYARIFTIGMREVFAHHALFCLIFFCRFTSDESA